MNFGELLVLYQTATVVGVDTKKVIANFSEAVRAREFIERANKHFEDDLAWRKLVGRTFTFDEWCKGKGIRFDEPVNKLNIESKVFELSQRMGFEPVKKAKDMDISYSEVVLDRYFLINEVV